MDLNNPTVQKRIQTMSESELEAFAESEAVSAAASSKVEGLVLDKDLLKTEILNGFRELRQNPS